MTSELAPEDEQGWIKWAQIALKYEGVDKAMEIMGAYLALNPTRAAELEAAYQAERCGSGTV